MKISERIMGTGYFVGLFGTLVSVFVALTFVFTTSNPIWHLGLIGIAIFGALWASAIAYGLKKGYLTFRQ